LAIANGYPTRSPDVLRALWDTEDDLFDSLRELADRHDFVMSGTFRLHDDVRDALRADLCEPVRRTRIQASCRRAATVIENELARQRDLLHTLDDQVNSATYLALLYDLVWYRFWMHPEAGWKSAMTLLPLLAVANEQATESLLRQMEWFAEHGTADEAARFDELAEPSLSSFLDELLARRRGQPVSRAKLAAKVTPTALAMLSRLTPDEGLLGAPLDRDAGLEVLRTRLLLTNELGESELTDATVKLQRLANSAPGLATPIAKTLMSTARAGVDSNASPGMLKAAGRAAIASNGLARQQGWELGHIALAFHHTPDLQDLTDQLYTVALEADPQRAPTLGNYANFLTDVRGDHDAAEAMYKRALEADPQHANNLRNYANLLGAVRGDHDAAEAMYKRALEADPQHARNLGNYARLLFIIGQDQEGERLARQAIPLASPREDALRAECNFYLFMHVPVARAEAAAALRELLCRNVSTGDWDFGQNLNRVHRSADSQYGPFPVWWTHGLAARISRETKEWVRHVAASPRSTRKRR
jgi:tetratricopeptide (TPR) repeat protein